MIPTNDKQEKTAGTIKVIAVILLLILFFWAVSVLVQGYRHPLRQKSYLEEKTGAFADARKDSTCPPNYKIVYSPVLKQYAVTFDYLNGWERPMFLQVDWPDDSIDWHLIGQDEISPSYQEANFPDSQSAKRAIWQHWKLILDDRAENEPKDAARHATVDSGYLKSHRYQ